MDITDRFAQRWSEWDRRVHQPTEARAFLDSAKDEELLELLAGDSAKDRKYERDIVTTEIQNRLATRNKEHPEGAEDVLRAAQVAYEAAAAGQKAIHTAEAILKASGDVELGLSVSAAAFVSLDTTKVAVDAAQAHVTDLQATVAQSRIAERLIEDAVQAAKDVADRAAEGAARLVAIGHEREAQAARDAALEIHSAAEVAARKLRRERR